MSEPIIAVERVTKQVQDTSGMLTILHEIDFTLRRGNRSAIVGASGSGKSTLLSIIAGLDTPTQRHGPSGRHGPLRLDEDARAAVRARQVGFVFQSFQLLGNLNALENVMLPLELQGRSDARARATEMLGASAWASACALSQGLVGRRAAARCAGACLRRAAGVLLADEPTGSLDFATGEKVMELMFELNRETGTTLVLVTHDRAIAARCDVNCGSRRGASRQAAIEAGAPTGQ